MAPPMVQLYHNRNVNKNSLLFKVDYTSWINFYTFFHKDGRITAVYEIDCDDHTESFDWELTAEEEFFFRNMMNRYCNKLYGCSVPALWSERETA